MAKSILKAGLRRLFGAYSYYCIFASPEDHRSANANHEDFLFNVDVDTLSNAHSETIRAQSWYAGSGSHTFVLLHQREIVAVCFYWFGDRYAERAYWPLKPSEAKLVQIVVDPAHRGCGFGPRLIEQSAAVMREFGFTLLYARIWHSNHPSLRAFQAAGWKQIARIVEVRLLGVGPRLRFQW